MSKNSIVLTLFLCVFTAFEANTDSSVNLVNIAVLEKGPTEQNGIELLAPNTIQGFTGIYRFNKQKMKVIYTEYPLPILKEWKAEKCFRRILYRLPYSTLFAFYYRDESGYQLFFEFPEKFKYFCEFINEFIGKFNIYRGFVKYKTDIPFPAVLNLRL